MAADDRTHPPVQHRPAPLRPGDRVAVIAPASAPHDADRATAGLDRLRAAGYEVEMAYTPGEHHGYLSAPDPDRLGTLNRCLNRSDLRALFCIRGGYGTLRILQSIDYFGARQNATLLVGYSDITALQLALYAKAGWTSLSAPVITEWGEADDATLDHFHQWARGNVPGPLASLDDAPLRPVSTGYAHGVLLGGNLSMLTRLIGTPFLPPLDGAILFLEDVGEAPYQIDRMLAHLDLAGLLDDLSGVVLGAFDPPDDAPDRPSLALNQVFHDYFARRPYPVAAGLQYGHFTPRLTIPIGVRAHLTVSDQAATLTPLEPVCA